ncbi:hypothetical protein SAMD00019534_002540, partial [Acytostelium subglobosum LB1]|uniref:hypothetical protein n=1 Tax=Acytostelium subglobosum LB1 TaxID=1410327 RepID=UPI000644D9B2
MDVNGRRRYLDRQPIQPAIAKSIEDCLTTMIVHWDDVATAEHLAHIFDDAIAIQCMTMCLMLRLTACMKGGATHSLDTLSSRTHCNVQGLRLLMDKMVKDGLVQMHSMDGYSLGNSLACGANNGQHGTHKDMSCDSSTNIIEWVCNPSFSATLTRFARYGNTLISDVDLRSRFLKLTYATAMRHKEAQARRYREISSKLNTINTGTPGARSVATICGGGYCNLAFRIARDHPGIHVVAWEDYHTVRQSLEIAAKDEHMKAMLECRRLEFGIVRGELELPGSDDIYILHRLLQTRTSDQATVIMQSVSKAMAAKQMNDGGSPVLLLIDMVLPGGATEDNSQDHHGRLSNHNWDYSSLVAMSIATCHHRTIGAWQSIFQACGLRMRECAPLDTGGGPSAVPLLHIMTLVLADGPVLALAPDQTANAGLVEAGLISPRRRLIQGLGFGFGS